MGDLDLVETDRKGKKKALNCRDDVGDSGYGIPYNVEKEKITLKGSSAKFVVAIETGGMFDRLVENGFDEDFDAILVHLKGQPAELNTSVHKTIERGTTSSHHRFHRW